MPTSENPQIPQPDPAVILPGAPEPNAPTPVRFQPSKLVLGIDRFMTQFIKVGGVLVVTAVFAIFFFILSQIIPLFRGAKVEPLKTISIPPGTHLALGLDEWSELPFVMDSSGRLHFIDVSGVRPVQEVDPDFSSPKTLTAVRYDPIHQNLVCGTNDGFFSIVHVDYEPSFSGEVRTINQKVHASPWVAIGQPGLPIKKLDYADTEDTKVVAVIQDNAGIAGVYMATLEQSHSLTGAGDIVPGPMVDLTPKIHGKPALIAINSPASDLVIATEEGDAYYFSRSEGSVDLRQTFSPFENRQSNGIASMEYLLGGNSLVLTNAKGDNVVYSLYQKQGAEFRTFGQIKEFPAMPAAAQYCIPSMRNRAFLIGADKYASLRYSTTENIRWQDTLPFSVSLAALGGKYDRIALVDKSSQLHLYKLEDPHPETSFKALFGKVWYDSADAPDYTWQSTGGADDFEPKLSLIPLIVGTFKGTLYAMIFALPVALLAAIYTSQFLHPRYRFFVKPTMEIMASLPSVVLGFMAALWLAPILETRVPTVLCAAVLIPMVALIAGWAWSTLPIRYRVWIRPGNEWIAIVPLFLVTCIAAWYLGPVIERNFFVIQDEGKQVADFRLWWPHVTGLSFEQRNSLVVGFMMGFAVIPIIFTIAEDSISSVPSALRSASLALGASRWQTTMRIILPTASAGIFSAIMIGLGRAVGETMIVVMATGNTPITSLNIFSGMRTLSANIAVELPEAPVNSSLYRMLFLGALALFLLTFIVNTMAELLRQHLREKYKTV